MWRHFCCRENCQRVVLSSELATIARPRVPIWLDHFRMTHRQGFSRSGFLSTLRLHRSFHLCLPTTFQCLWRTNHAGEVVLACFSTIFPKYTEDISAIAVEKFKMCIICLSFLKFDALATRFTCTLQPSWLASCLALPGCEAEDNTQPRKNLTRSYRRNFHSPR